MTLGAAVQIMLWLGLFCLVFGGAFWAVDYFEVKQPFNKFAKGVIIILAVLVLVYAIFDMFGGPQLPHFR